MKNGAIVGLNVVCGTGIGYVCHNICNGRLWLWKNNCLVGIDLFPMSSCIAKGRLVHNCGYI